MRVKHQNPLIIDIIDSHDIFKKQWTKRKAFYQKNNYMISYTDDYRRDKWTEITKKEKNKKNNESDEIDSIPMGKCLITISQIWGSPCPASKVFNAVFIVIFSCSNCATLCSNAVFFASNSFVAAK